MRIDKYLKLTRLIKRRSVAKELLDRNLFLINGKIAKPSQCWCKSFDEYKFLI